MNLNDYLNSPGSLSIADLAVRIGINNVAQIRQWQHGYAGRLPSPENCVSIEQATGRKVMRWDLRPNDWWLIWPELIKTDGAPDPIPNALASVIPDRRKEALETIAPTEATYTGPERRKEDLESAGTDGLHLVNRRAPAALAGGV